MTLDEQIEYLIDRRNYPFVKIRLKVYENILASLEELKQIKINPEYYAKQNKIIKSFNV